MAKEPPKSGPGGPERNQESDSAMGSARRQKRFADLVRDNFPIIRFVLTTFVALVLLFYILHQEWMVQHVVTPYTHFITSLSRLGLRIIGVDAGGTGERITSPQFSVAIKNICNGLEVTAIFLATVLGFPSSWKSKIVGLGVGYPLIFLINIIRIMVLFVLGYKMPSVFEAVHYYYAQAFVIMATVGIWLFWVMKYSTYGSKTRYRISD